MEQVRIGTRDSILAKVQAEMVRTYIQESVPEKEAILVPMKTTGDKILDRRLDQIGGKGLFVKELDLALLEKRSDLSVHSLKDVPMEVADELPLLGCSLREDPRDVLVLPEGKKELDQSLPIGCSSKRRILQFKKLYPDMQIKSVRGNVQTRLSKLDAGEYSGLILAAAGLKRIGLEHRISRYFTVEEMIPAAGQGILALQGRAGEDYSYLEDFLDEDATCQAVCERAFTRAVNGGCSAPIAAYAAFTETGDLKLTGLYCEEDRTDLVTGTIAGERSRAEQLGQELAERLREQYRRKE